MLIVLHDFIALANFPWDCCRLTIEYLPILLLPCKLLRVLNSIACVDYQKIMYQNESNHDIDIRMQMNFILESFAKTCRDVYQGT